jgi:hypothetical protein
VGCLARERNRARLRCPSAAGCLDKSKQCLVPNS